MRHLALIALAVTACNKPASKDQPAPSQPPQGSGSSSGSGPAPAPPPQGSASTMTPATPPPTDLVMDSNHFALALWAKAGTGNVAISPASIATALTIAWGGAKGETAAQMQKILQLRGPADSVLNRWGELYKSLAHAGEGSALSVATRLYGEKTYPFDTTYFNVVRKAFDVWIEPVDFATAAEETRKKINDWVAETTAQRIKDLLPVKSVDDQTRLVIVNAMYFLATWASQFEVSSTWPRDFYVDGTTKKQVATMAQTHTFKYASADGASMVELPYKGDRTTMYILLPDARDGLPALEQKLEPTLKSLVSKLAPGQVSVMLPRFTVDPPAPMNLAEVLKSLGMTDAFDRKKADFSNIAQPKNPDDKLFISAVFHKAFVKVDERGTEAAAATAVVMARAGGAPPKATTFAADHPFLFVIADRASGLILFMGRVTDPK